MQLRQTGHTRLLALEILDQEISLSAKLFDIFNKLQTEGITLNNESVHIYFNWNWSSLDITFVGVEVHSILSVQDPFQLIDFTPEFCYGMPIQLEDGMMETPELLKLINDFNTELTKQGLSIGAKGRISFKWGEWSDELQLELFSVENK
jgi:hypothetical protein